MNRYYYVVLIIVVTSFFFGCSSNQSSNSARFGAKLFTDRSLPKDVRTVLALAKENKSELLTVIEHYKEKPEEYKAALFLIGNMRNKYSTMSSNYSELLPLLSQIDSLLTKGDSQEEINGLVENGAKKFSSIPAYSSIQFDYAVIKAQFLIENIDWAFKVWREKPWAKHLDFDQFCEWILPYRVADEPLQNWRPFLYNELSWIEDSVEKSDSPANICQYLNDYIAHRFHFSDDLSFVPTLGGIDQYRYRSGLCDHRYRLIIFSMRSLGIPVALDNTPRSCRGTISHAWTVLLDIEGIKTFNGGEDWAYLVHPPSCPLSGDEHIPVTTVFRSQFAMNYESLIFKTKREEIPPYFLNYGQKEVSSEYSGNIQGDIPIDIPRELFKKRSYLYLFVLSSGNRFIPVAYAKTVKRKALFKNMGRDAIYFAGYYKDGIVTPVTDAFIFPETPNAEIENIKPDFTNSEKITLYRKFYVHYHMNLYADYMVGTKIEGSNDRYFSDPSTLFTVTEKPISFKEIFIENDKPYRYYRYMAHDSLPIRLAEINLFYQDKEETKCRITGEVYGYAPNVDTEDDKVFINAFDNNTRTNFNAPAKSWVAIDAGKEVTLTSLRLVARNNWNIVEPKNIYQLYYFDRKWKLFAEKKSDDYHLEFDNVPINAPLLLHNKSQGTEECVFRWENGEQVFY